MHLHLTKASTNDLEKATKDARGPTRIILVQVMTSLKNKLVDAVPKLKLAEQNRLLKLQAQKEVCILNLVWNFGGPTQTCEFCDAVVWSEESVGNLSKNGHPQFSI
ncbi:hypothetical protein vseg_001846 [Gypsophila vaccaria]